MNSINFILYNIMKYRSRNKFDQAANFRLVFYVFWSLFLFSFFLNIPLSTKGGKSERNNLFPSSGVNYTVFLAPLKAHSYFVTVFSR